MLLFGLSDTPASAAGAVEACPECGGAAHIDGGACVSCLLRGGLAPSSRAQSSRNAADTVGEAGLSNPDEVTENVSNDNWYDLLTQINIHDSDWRLGNYQILGELGRGGMGVIYRARQRHSRRIVALKRVLSYHSESRETLERFRREAEAAASLDHPNILPIYEVGEADDLPFFTMKFATGGSLQKVAPILRESPRECVRLVMKITRAVAYAHGEGILHRDLKPGNILLDARGEPLVSDFGLAKWLDGTIDLTRTLTIFGTPGYIAPEQAHSSANELTPAADIYSIGAILFDLLTGRPPFLGDHALAVIKQACEKPAPQLRSLVPRANRDLETMCARCLERDPAARYQSAAELAEDLERWLEGRPIKARAVSPIVKLWRWTKRNPLIAASLATIFIVLSAATFISLQERQVALNRNKDLQHTLQDASRADHETAHQRFRAGTWREGLALMGRSLTFWPGNHEAANYLLTAIIFGHGDSDKLPILGVQHKGPIEEADFSPDGRYFVTASDDGTGRIWDASTGAPVGKPLQHSAPLWCARFSPDGTRVVTTDEDGLVRLWDARTGEPVAKAMQHGKPELDSVSTVETVAFSRDGHRLLTASWDHTARLWNAETGDPIAELVGPFRVSDAVFSPDESRIIMSYWNGGAILWDAKTFKPIGPPMKHTDTVRRSMFTPDGNKIVTSCLGEKVARIWDGHTALPLGPPLTHSDYVWNLDISRDGKLLATACSDKTARLWSVEDGSPRGIPLRHEGPVNTAVFSPDGKRLVTASRDKTARLWDVTTCTEIGSPMWHDDTVLKAIFTPDGSKVLSMGADGAAYLWATVLSAWPGESIAVSGEVCCAEFDKNADSVFLATREGNAGIWSLSKKQFITPLVHHGGAIVAATFHPTTKRCATFGSDGVIRFWDMPTGRKVGETAPVPVPILASEFAGDGKSVLTAHRHSLVLNWKIPEGTQLGAKIELLANPNAIAAAPLTPEVVVSSGDDRLSFWNSLTGTPSRSRFRISKTALALSYRPDGQFIAAGCEDHTARIWSLDGKQIGEPLYLNGRGTSIRYTPDGNRLLVGGVEDSEVTCYDARTHESPYLPLPHQTGVSHITSNANGSLVITVTTDGVARLWRIPSTNDPPPKWLPDYLRALGGLAFSPQQQLVQVSTRERLELRKKLLAQPRENSIWDKVMRQSFSPKTEAPPAMQAAK